MYDTYEKSKNRFLGKLNVRSFPHFSQHKRQECYAT